MHMLQILDAGVGSDAIPQFDKDFLSHFDPIQVGREHFLDLTRGNGPPRASHTECTHAGFEEMVATVIDFFNVAMKIKPRQILFIFFIKL